ncbi:MAG: hypothetical protein RRZ33_05260 [Lachnospiraceae bacterium]
MKVYKRIVVLILLAMLVATLSACTDAGGKVTTGHGGLLTTEDPQQDQETPSVLYRVIGRSRKTKQLAFEKIGGSSRQYHYFYNGTTYVLDKYGKNRTISFIQPGDVVELKIDQETDVIMEIQHSDEVWCYEDVENYSVDLEKKIFSIGEKQYGYEDSILVVEGKKVRGMEDLDQMDILKVTGRGSEILTIAVTTGHGKVHFIHTKEFEGGYLTIGNVCSAKIIKDLQLTMREGEFQLWVASNGYGGTDTIHIRSGKITTIDLSKYKTEKMSCKVTFKGIQEDVKITLNGDPVEMGQPFTLSYGSYKLTAAAKGYQTWSGMLVISSKEATILIDLSQITDKKDGKDEQTVDKDSDEHTPVPPDSHTDTHTNTNSGEDIEKDDTTTESNTLIDDVVDVLTSGGD